MIKIEVENIDNIKNDYFNGIKSLILERVNFYLTAFKVMDRRPGYAVELISTYPGIRTVTKTALLKILGRTSSSFSNRSNFLRIRNAHNLNLHFYSQRVGYINLLSALSDESNLKSLLLAEVDDLIPINNSYTQGWFTIETVTLLQELIPYHLFINKDTKPYNAYDLSDALKINVCVYCNRIYTNTVIGKGRRLIIRPTLDHYFNQSAYPLLGLSFYNLIPACNYCNSNLKGQKPFSLNFQMHPYQEGFGQDATFDYLQVGFFPDKSDGRNYKVIINENIALPDLKHPRLFGAPGMADSGNINVFKIKEIYQGHTDIIGELIVKSDKLSPYYAGNIIKILTSLGASKKEFYRFYFSNYLEEKDFNKRPLAKLTKDIVIKYLPEVLDKS